jgi:FAD/FMN-containing dehydrogenase
MSRRHAPLAIVNRVGNPVVRVLLRSPLHVALSGQLALITLTGRRSGRAFTLPVGYRRDGRVVKIAVGSPQRKRWWRNLLDEGAPVRMRIRGTDYTGHAVALGDEQHGVTVEVTLD